MHTAFIGIPADNIGDELLMHHPSNVFLLPQTEVSTPMLNTVGTISRDCFVRAEGQLEFPTEHSLDFSGKSQLPPRVLPISFPVRLKPD